MTAKPPLLLTPGPLTTSDRVKRAMLRDWGARDPEFAALTEGIRRDLARIGGADDSYTVVPLQGSGSFAVEAMLATLVAPEDGVLVPANGAYGQRIAAICARLGLRHRVVETPDDAPLEPGAIAEALAADATLGVVAAVQCETTSGLWNPIPEIAAVCRAAGRRLLVDSMSGFGALPVDIADWGLTALAASSNKCLQSVPGLGFVMTKKAALSRADHTPPSLVLDLAAQDRQFLADGQWRFTPPTHVVAALAEALAELAEEGGPPARLARYAQNAATLAKGMKALGFTPALAARHQAPIILSFHEPDAPGFEFEAFYDALKAEGYAIYAGKMRAAKTFRVGVIGDIGPRDIEGFLAAVARVRPG